VYFVEDAVAACMVIVKVLHRVFASEVALTALWLVAFGDGAYYQAISRGKPASSERL
jgi:hypothetical protein